MSNLDWTFYVTCISLFPMKHKLINFDWIVNNFIVANLLINYLNLIKDSIQKQLFTEQMLFEIGVLKNFAIFRRKQPVLESFLQLFCEFYKIFKNSFFHKTPPVSASEKVINFPGKHQWRNRFIFLISTTK